jgi:hypothetical protein
VKPLAAALALVAALGVAKADGRARFDGGGVAFELPQGWRAAATETAIALTPPAALSLTASLTLDGNKLGDGDLENAADERHAARVKNRVAWGMKATGGPPREPLRAGTRRAVRYRDRVGGALGSSEQIMTCAIVKGRLACFTSSGPAESRDAAEAAASLILSTLTLRR